MNCEQGDLAVIVKAFNPDNLGRIVQCIKFFGIMKARGPHGVTNEPCWLLDKSYISFKGELENVCPDRCLRPLRNSPGEDETLQWAGKPAIKELEL